MTMTDTADAAGTARQCIELAEAGSEMVRVTVNLPESAAAVPEIKQRMLDAGCTAPLIGDFHYDETVNRAISVDVRAMQEILRKIFDANHIADELLKG